MMQKLKWISGFALLTAAQVSHAAPLENDNINYVVKRGDTLIGLAERYFLRVDSYKIVQQKNRIGNVRALPVGKTIIIPRSLIKYTLSQAKVLSVRGDVKSNQGPVTAGQIFGEGAQLITAPSSFLTLGLGNGSRVSLPSNSGLKIRTLRNYALGDSLDYDFDLSRGGARSSVIPLKSQDDRYRIRTPKAVSAVRGTDFQVRYDAEKNSDFAEVVEGGLTVGLGLTAALPLPAGKGLAVPAAGDAITESLLPEPKLIDAGKVQANPAVLFSAEPAANEVGYRFTVAADAGFVEQLADQVVAGSKVDFTDLANGNYFIRARAISANGIQGLPTTFTFKRRLNGVSAGAGKDESGYAFKWQSVGEGVNKFHFQLFRGSPAGLPLVDEPAVAANQVSLSDLLPGTYFWRVGSVQFLDGEAATNWTSFEKLSVAP
jgi:hypothetical protein